MWQEVLGRGEGGRQGAEGEEPTKWKKLQSTKCMLSNVFRSLTIFFIAGIAVPVGVLIEYCADGVPTPTNQ